MYYNLGDWLDASGFRPSSQCVYDCKFGFFSVIYINELQPSRADAIGLCAAYQMTIAYPTNMEADMEENHEGLGACGWTWARYR